MRISAMVITADYQKRWHITALLEEQEAEASRKAEEIIKKARQLAELEQQKEREALKEQFGQLVALAAAQVTGKMLTEEDQRRINREAIDSLDS